MLWSKRYRFWYQLHRINILVCSWTGPVVYVEGVNSRLDEDRQKIYLALGKKILSTSPMSILKRRRYTFMSCLRQLDILQQNTEQELRDNFRDSEVLFCPISRYFVGKTRAGDTLLLDIIYPRRRTLCSFQSSNMMSLKIREDLQLFILRQGCRQKNPSYDHLPVNLGHSC